MNQVLALAYTFLMPPPKAAPIADADNSTVSHPAWVRHIVIAQWGRTYAEALKEVCTRAFPWAEVTPCCSGADTLAQLRTKPADILLLAMTFPDMDGVDLLPLIAEGKLSKRVLVASHRREEHSLLALRAARFDGLIDTLEESVDTLIKALHLVANGQAYISPAFRAHMLDRNPPNDLAQKLTPAEIHVLAEIGDGSGNSEAATRLGLSESTVQTHRRNIMRKLGISSSARLVREAIRLGIVRITTDGGIIRPGFAKITPALLKCGTIVGLLDVLSLLNIG